MSTQQTNRSAHAGRALQVLAAIATAAVLGACGGGDDAVSHEISVQHQKEAAALAKAHALNADAMGKIKAERAAGQRNNAN